MRRSPEETVLMLVANKLRFPDMVFLSSRASEAPVLVSLLKTSIQPTEAVHRHRSREDLIAKLVGNAINLLVGTFNSHGPKDSVSMPMSNKLNNPDTNFSFSSPFGEELASTQMPKACSHQEMELHLRSMSEQLALLPMIINNSSLPASALHAYMPWEAQVFMPACIRFIHPEVAIWLTGLPELSKHNLSSKSTQFSKHNQCSRSSQCSESSQCSRSNQCSRSTQCSNFSKPRKLGRPTKLNRPYKFKRPSKSYRLTKLNRFCKLDKFRKRPSVPEIRL